MARTTPMTYTNNRTVVFVETSLFTKLLKLYFNDDEYRAMQEHIMREPTKGSIIRGSGGIRKIRWGQNSKGKSGGVRVIYYWHKKYNQIYMLTIYSKSDKDNLDNKTLSDIRKYLETL